MKNCAITRCFLLSILVAITCIGCKSTTKAEQPKKEQDYFRLYITDVEKDTLKGPVKSIKDSTFKVSLKFGEIIKISMIKSDHKEYDPNGRWLVKNNSSYEYIKSDSTLTTRGYGPDGELNSYSIAYFPVKIQIKLDSVI